MIREGGQGPPEQPSTGATGHWSWKHRPEQYRCCSRASQEGNRPYAKPHQKPHHQNVRRRRGSGRHRHDSRLRGLECRERVRGPPARPHISYPQIGTTSQAGYEASGRDFRYISSTLTVPDTSFLTGLYPQEYIQLSNGSLAGGDQYVRAGHRVVHRG